MKIHTGIVALKGSLSRIVILSIVFIGIWLIIIPQSRGCNVPVFRYALERWPADLYEVAIFHRGPLDSEGQALLEKLQYDSGANIYVSTFDVSGKLDQQALDLWKSQSEPELPWMVLTYPRHVQVREPVWAAHLTDSNVETLLRSPVREKVAGLILAGDSAVWVLMESGVKEKDEEAALLLKTQLSRMEEVLEIPEQNDFEEYMGYELAEEIKIAFSVVHLARNDPAEQVLIQMLLRNDPELQASKEPIAFPVFGRGRALCALTGYDIDEFNIEEISAFITGPCSCQVKAINPGLDLFISADWDGMLGQQIAEEYSEQPLVTTTTAPVSLTDQRSGSLKRNILIVAFIQIVIVVFAASVVLWRRKRREI